MLRFIGRLMLHGPKLVWRILAILLGVAGGSMWEAVRSNVADSRLSGAFPQNTETEDAAYWDRIDTNRWAYQIRDVYDE